MKAKIRNCLNGCRGFYGKYENGGYFDIRPCTMMWVGRLMMAAMRIPVMSSLWVCALSFLREM
jgi:hypothetical protein